MNLLPRDRLIAAIAQTVIFFGLVRWLLRAHVIEILLRQPKPPRAQPPSRILKQTPPLSKRIIFLEISKFVLQERQFGAQVRVSAGGQSVTPGTSDDSTE